MKKLFLFAALLSVLLLAGCGSKQNETATGSAPDASTSSEASPLPEDTLGKVMGAAMYRGTITDITEATLTIEQYSGTNFGYPSLQFTIDENTKMNVKPEELVLDMFVEIYYGPPSGGGLVQPVKAIQVKKLPGAELVYVNGEVVKLTSASGQEGTILIKRTDDMGEVLVHYYANTQFYLNFDDIKEGYKINVFTTGAATHSIPPQINALEVRPYAEPKQ